MHRLGSDFIYQSAAAAAAAPQQYSNLIIRHYLAGFAVSWAYPVITYQASEKRIFVGHGTETQLKSTARVRFVVMVHTVQSAASPSYEFCPPVEL